MPSKNNPTLRLSKAFYSTWSTRRASNLTTGFIALSRNLTETGVSLHIMPRCQPTTTSIRYSNSLPLSMRTALKWVRLDSYVSPGSHVIPGPVSAVSCFKRLEMSYFSFKALPNLPSISLVVRYWYCFGTSLNILGHSLLFTQKLRWATIDFT